jgi:hypothetical protein
MDLIAWSQNMTPEAAKAAGAILVSKDQLFKQADILTIHVVLSSRTRGLVGVAELERMKPTARLINTSRGPIVEEQALVSALKSKQIAGISADHTDARPLFGEQYRRRKTDPAARPGNDDVLVDHRHNDEFVSALFIWEVPLGISPLARLLNLCSESVYGRRCTRYHAQGSRSLFSIIRSSIMGRRMRSRSSTSCINFLTSRSMSSSWLSMSLKSHSISCLLLLQEFCADAQLVMELHIMLKGRIVSQHHQHVNHGSAEAFVFFHFSDELPDFASDAVFVANLVEFAFHSCLSPRLKKLVRHGLLGLRNPC